MTKVEKLINSIWDKVLCHRKWLHAHPELSGQEKNTASYLRWALSEMGLALKENIGGYGICAVIEGEKDGKCLALRADFDALPLVENTGLPFSSVNKGVFHACGHDMHTAMLLGAAEVLLEIDLSNEKGKAVLLKLIKESDVVIDNFRPGTLEKLGLSFSKMREVNEKIIYGNLSGFGTYGPYRDFPAYDIIAQAMSGMMMLNGENDTPPIKVGTSIADIVAGMNLVIGILAALHKRERTKKGCFLETSLTDSLISALMMEYITYLHSGKMPERTGNNYREWCPAGAFAARDGYYVLAIGKEDEFIRLAKDVLCNDEIAYSEQFNSHSKRVEKRREINDAIEAWSKNLTIEEVCTTLRKADIPCNPVYDTRDVMEDTHIFEYRNMFLKYAQPETGNITVTNIPVKFHALDLPTLSPAPQCGEHTDDILKNLLLLSEQEIDSLKKAELLKRMEQGNKVFLQMEVNQKMLKVHKNKHVVFAITCLFL